MVALQQASSATGLTNYGGAQFSLLSYCFATGLVCNRPHLQQALQQAPSATGLMCNMPRVQQATPGVVHILIYCHTALQQASPAAEWGGNVPHMPGVAVGHVGWQHWDRRRAAHRAPLPLLPHLDLRWTAGRCWPQGILWPAQDSVHCVGFFSFCFHFYWSV